MRAVRTWFADAIVAGTIVYFFLTPSVTSRHASPETACLNRLRNISTAIQNYAVLHAGVCPAAYGRPEGVEVSWRVEILPHLDQTALYDVYDRSQRWFESPNDVLAEIDVHGFSCPEAAESSGRFHRTTYVAVTGDATIWAPTPVALEHVSRADGLATTLMIGERHHDRPVWSEPRDSAMPGTLPDVIANNHDERIPNVQLHEDANDTTVFSSPHARGVNVMYADGHAAVLPSNIDPMVLRALLTADGKEDVDPSGF